MAVMTRSRHRYINNLTLNALSQRISTTQTVMQANAAREHLLNALTTRAQQMSMQCASNDRVRALLVKQKKVGAAF